MYVLVIVPPSCGINTRAEKQGGGDAGCDSLIVLPRHKKKTGDCRRSVNTTIPGEELQGHGGARHERLPLWWGGGSLGDGRGARVGYWCGGDFLRRWACWVGNFVCGMLNVVNQGSQKESFVLVSSMCYENMLGKRLRAVSKNNSCCGVVAAGRAARKKRSDQIKNTTHVTSWHALHPLQNFPSALRFSSFFNIKHFQNA